MMQRVLVAVLALSLAACVFAQPDPNQPGGGRQGGGQGQGGGNFQAPMTDDNTKFEVNAYGIFVIHNGVVAKYSANLNPVGVKELFDPLPPQPKAANPQNVTAEERANIQAWSQLLSERQGPFAQIVKDEMLHLVIGARYFRVNMKTLGVEVKAELKAAADANAGANPQGRGQFMRQAPMLKLDGNTLFVLGNQSLFAVNTASGAVTNAVMPKEMFPTVDYRALWGGFAGGNRGANAPDGPGGNRGGGGGGGGGNRGGDQGGAAGGNRGADDQPRQ